LESRTTRQMCRRGFSGDPLSGERWQSSRESFETQLRLSNYKYTAVLAFHVRIWSSLYYPCLVIMSSGEIVLPVPIAVGDRLARHASLTLCLPFLCRYECQYGPKDRSDETLNITPDMERGPRKYDIKGKNVSNGRRKSQL
jgi:hypothetical protein